jgi:lysophospholipase L1-like esterase
MSGIRKRPTNCTNTNQKSKERSSMKFQIKRGITMLLAVGAALALGAHSAWAQIKVACVGDSITAGYGLANPGAQSYPAQLQALLGGGYWVGNYGNSGTTVLKRSDNTYWNSWAYRQSMQFKPNIVVIMFGANDSKPWNWNAAKFNADYKALIAKYQGLSSSPQVYVCLTTPVFTPNPFGNAFDPLFMQNTVIPAIQAVAQQAGVPLIDNNAGFLNQPGLFSDGVHPTTLGAGIIAGNVTAAIAP